MAEGNVIYHLLSNDADVTNIVSDRIYPNKAPQAKRGDFIVFKRPTGSTVQIKNGKSGKDDSRWQVDGYCHNDDDRDLLEEAIRSALDRKSGTINGVNIERIRFLNWNNAFDDDGELYRTSADYRIKTFRS